MGGVSDTKAFPTRDVLSTITGRLMGETGGVYEVLSFMTGESVYTHQIPRICREAQPVLVAAHPELAAAIEEAKQVNPDNYLEWRGRWEARYGLAIDVPKFSAEAHESIVPTADLPAPRIDTDPEARRMANQLGATTARISGAVGRMWTTQHALDAAKADLLRLAEEALALHRVLSK